MNPPVRPSGSTVSSDQPEAHNGASGGQGFGLPPTGSKIAIYCAVALLVILLSLAASLAG